jgi:tRNA pseudouridine38-40 synthase
MVRSVVGFCVAVGTSKRSARDVETVFTAKDRSSAAPIAPPHGLTLVHVTYPSDD